MCCCARENRYTKHESLRRDDDDFHTVRLDTLPEVIANEVEPLTTLTTLIRNVAHMPRDVVTRRVRRHFQDGDLQLFESDYAERAVPGESKPSGVGRPFLLEPRRFRAGIVLVHGYLSAPEEIRAMAEYFREMDYAVYGVRLRGHGTTPDDLARTPWEEWYRSLNRGYAVIRTMTDRVILGGFSTGGTLALLAAGRKGARIESVFAINPPQTLRRYMARYASSIVSMNALLSKFRRGGSSWEFVENNPENRHINYLRNPLTGVRELGESMKAMEEALPRICVPTLIVQGSEDPIVDPAGAQVIFGKRRHGPEGN